MPGYPPPETTLAFAHRGGTDGGYPENSLAAFAHALSLGAMIETDVRLSLDGVPVLVHDVVQFRRGLPIWVSILPARVLGWLGIPRLADLYRSLGSDHVVSMDLKEARAWPAVLAVARRFHAVDKLWLVHDDLDVLSQIRAADPDVHLVHEARPQALEARGETLVDHPARLAKLGIDAQNTRANAWTKAARQAARDAGILAFGSMVQTEKAQRKAARLGLDGLYTDHVDGLVGAISEAVAEAKAKAEAVAETTGTVDGKHDVEGGDEPVTVTVAIGDEPDAAPADAVSVTVDGADDDDEAGTEAAAGDVTVTVTQGDAVTPDSAPTIRGVLFDFGSTLFHHPAGPDTVRTEAAELGVDLEYDQAVEVWDIIDRAAMDPDEVARGRDVNTEVWHERWKVLYALGDDRVPGLGKALDRSYHDPEAWRPYADAGSTLRELSQAGVPVGIVSNTGWDIRAVFRQWGFDRFVTAYTLSYEVGATKPDPTIFLAACAAIDVDPASVLMIGDDAKADSGAVPAGLAGVVLVDSTTPPSQPHGLAEAVAPALEAVDRD